MAEKEESKFGKYLSLYFSQFHRGTQESRKGDWGTDIFWPFKFVWFTLVNLWGALFGKRDKF